jgi:hypothetical protein
MYISYIRIEFLYEYNRVSNVQKWFEITKTNEKQKSKVIFSEFV